MRRCLRTLALTLGSAAALSGCGSPPPLAPFAGAADGVFDPLAYRDGRRADFERRAAAGLAHVLYAKSPGGVQATARRVARYRPIVESVAAQQRLDPDLLEALVFLESGGRPDARAGADLSGAVGLTQILAGTARDLLGMRVDEQASARLTRGIVRGRRVQARKARRREVDERFDPVKALQATGRYLAIARSELRRDDLSFESYHMGIGNLQGALRAYGAGEVPYAQLFFDSTPLRHAPAWSALARLGDDSSTYLWRLYAARDVMRLWRADPQALRERTALQTARDSAELVLHPPARTPAFATPPEVAAAGRSRALVPLDPTELPGLRVVGGPGVLRPAASALLRYLGLGVRDIARTAPLTVDATVRAGPGAAGDDSLHATGFAFDVRRRYRTPAQAQAFQFALDRLTALNLIAWVRRRGAIHVTVAGDAARVLAR